MSSKRANLDDREHGAKKALLLHGVMPCGARAVDKLAKGPTAEPVGLKGALKGFVSRRCPMRIIIAWNKRCHLVTGRQKGVKVEMKPTMTTGQYQSLRVPIKLEKKEPGLVNMSKGRPEMSDLKKRRQCLKPLQQPRGKAGKNVNGV